jgi:hypothetical protein
MKRFITAWLILLSMPFAYADSNQNTKGVEELQKERIIQRLSRLNYDKLEALFDYAGIKQRKDLYKCLCAHAPGVASAGVGLQYHPEPYDASPACREVGDPCIAVGFGCWRFPLPNDTFTWKRCIEENPVDGNESVVEALLNKRVKKVTDISKNLNESECRKLLHRAEKNKNMSQTIAGKTKLSDGLQYLADEGYPLIEPPESMARKIRRDLMRLSRLVAKEFAKKEKALKKNIQNHLISQLAKEIFSKKDTYENAFKMASTVATYIKNKNELELKDLKEDVEYLHTIVKKYQKTDSKKYAEALKVYKQRRRRMLALEKKIERTKSDIDKLAISSRGLDMANDLWEYKKTLQKLGSQDGKSKVEGAIESSKLIQKYFGVYKDHLKNKNFDDFKKFAKEKMSDSDFQKMMFETAERDMIYRSMDKLNSYAEKGMSAYNAYLEYEKEKKRMIRKFSSGRYTQAQKNLLASFAVMSKLSDKMASKLPTGMSDVVGFYSKAMMMPEKFDELIRKIVNRSDEYADIKGDQIGTKVMKKYSKKYGYSLSRDSYLFRKAGLSVYAMEGYHGKKPYVVMAKSDGDPIFISKRLRDKLVDFAFYYPIVYKRRLDDADLYEMLSKMGDKGDVYTNLKEKGRKIIEDAAKKKRIARMYGKKVVSDHEIRQWNIFKMDILNKMPVTYSLSENTIKKWFDIYRNHSKDKVRTLMTKWVRKIKQCEKKLHYQR